MGSDGSKRPRFVAEISANHLGKRPRAEAMVDMAAMAGANAVKFQTYDPERLVGDHKLVLKDGPWKGRNLVDLYREAWTPRTWLPDLFAQAKGRGIMAFSSPFSAEDVDFLEGLACPLYKIASFEITDLGLVRYAAQTGKPMVLSTGMATLGEIEEAVDCALEYAPHVTILKCTSGYPSPAEELNLLTIADLWDYFGRDDERIDVGLSDHTRGPVAAIVAASMGAAMFEKHFTIARKDGGPDAAFSAEPHEFTLLVRQCNEALAARGSVRYGPTASELPQLHLRRALWVVKPIAQGETFSVDNLQARRPCFGFPLLPVDMYLGKRAGVAIEAGTFFDPGKHLQAAA